MIKQKFILVISFMLFFVAEIFAVPPTWSVNPGDYNYNMTITGVVNLDFVESLDANDLVGAFIDNECRGVQNLVLDAATGRYVAYLMVYSNSVTGTIQFKVYDASADAEITIPVLKDFSVDGIVGSTEAPYIWSNPTLSNEAEMLTFSIPGQTGGTTYSGTDIYVVVPFGTDVTALVADYTTSPYARVQVAGTTQTTGVTANNFTSPLEYTVRAADETAEQLYTVTLTFANATPSDIFLTSVDILESAGLGSIVGVLSAEDSNLADIHTFSLVAGTGDADNGSFNISTNELQLNTALDFETKTSYTIRIQTDDANGGLFEKQFTINIIDENDETPQVTAATLSLPENEPLQAVLTVIATDADITTAFKVLTYSISGGNEEVKFSIHPTDGVISLIAALDFEITTVYELEISVTDGVNTGINIITVNVTDENDETPVITDATVQLLETTLPGEEIWDIVVTDADANSTFSYSITNGNTGSDFAINPANGIITVANGLDFETTTSYSLEISISDGINTGVGVVTVNIVDVNDEIPQLAVAAVDISESTVLNTAIHTVTATDADANTTFTYSIVSGNTGTSFGINANTGVIQVLSALDFENITTYFLTVAANDGIHTGTGIITISLLDENDEVPVITDETIQVAEIENIGFSVTDIIATDADAASVFTYYITAGNADGKFAVNLNTGEITLADVLNYELVSQYTLSLRVNDGVNNGFGEIIINIEAINDEFPVVTNAIVNLAESAIFGQIVHQTDASDPDGGTILTFEITNGNTGSAFGIDPGFGIITVLGSLDYETTPVYELEVTVNDGLHTSTGIITINLLNENDETPIVTPAEISLNEDLASGSQVYQVEAIDPDGTQVLEYSIIAGNAGNVFAIEPVTGIITLAGNLDYEMVTSYLLEIGVNDGVATGNNTITINIIDINDETPIIENGVAYIDETATVPSNVFSVTAFDQDAGTFLIFNISSGNAAGRFQIIDSTGVITLIAELDFESVENYTLQISVYDGAETAFANVEINVLDKNDELPVVLPATVYVPENATLGHLVHSMQATDADAGANLTYELTNGNDSLKFAINEQLGTIMLTGNLDYETEAGYVLGISVSDGLHISTGTVYVNITDIDDNIPVVQDAEISVEETEQVGTIVHTVVATDADAISVLNYTIFAGNQDNKFIMNPTSGAITLTEQLDFETKTDFVLQVDVTDGTNTASGIITIHLEDMNDEIPIFSDTLLTVSEFADIGTIIGQLTANDADANSDLSFSISVENMDGVFELSMDGEVSLAEYIDFETQPTYELTINIYDGLNTGSGKLTVQLENADESLFNAVNVFSPNGDGINDFWKLENNFLFRECEFFIFNNIGEIILQQTGYNNDWDGTYNGQPLSVGTYYYVVKCPDCTECKHAGFISILR